MGKISTALIVPIVLGVAITGNPKSDRRSEIKPSYHTINAYVCEVDEDEWYGVCASFEKHTFYGFEIFDEINVGDNIRAVICDNATPLIYYDDYITQVYYGW